MAAVTAVATAVTAAPSVAIVGGSIAGLAAATAFHRLGWRVRVFERAAAQGLGGSLGFCDVRLWRGVAGRTMMRRGEPASRAQGAFLYRDLWNFWNDGLPEGTVVWNAEVDDLGPDPSRPTVFGEPYDLAVIADGGWSALRSKYFPPASPEYAGYSVWRFRVRAEDVPGFDAYGEYHAAGSDGTRHATILLDVAADDGTDWIMGGTSFAAPEPAYRPNRGAARQTATDGPTPPPPEWFLPKYKALFGRAAGGEVYRAMEAAAKKGKIAELPQYEFGAAQVAQGRLILVGDAAHMASPRTASGAHTAVLDAAGLLEAFFPVARTLDGKPHAGPKAGIDEAVEAYAPGGKQRARQLYERSVEVSAPVQAPGWKRKRGWKEEGLEAAREEL
ncbi:hypothetical protein DFJ74DRAFT_669222 [Hyaloraphidium curvatum]|nr:hypothetical protein DFJ74DRAFT_669222 [Hyaloraphidium curvatum]